jgi:hypothetical protein
MRKIKILHFIYMLIVQILLDSQNKVCQSSCFEEKHL